MAWKESGDMACGNNKVSRGYLTSQPAAPPPQPSQPARPTDRPRRQLPRDTSLDSGDRVWEMKGTVRYEGDFLEKEGAHVYFGGLGKADGPGHGHGFIDSRGNFTVFRDPWDPSKGGRARAAATGQYVPSVRKRR